ncbi:hypothetical protein BLA29_015276 [Euroglyphus maynei]|uniref:Uncharacterized protein n=1 Tax=Euroglyphus maynei TaxID=6958 RepID=A0A1Y3AWM0_EURMA|nr:hypothetical protein BLA29_015276 [Euroglyphus maynei]
MEILQVDPRTQAYIQYKTIKKTAESILIDLREGLEEIRYDEDMDRMMATMEGE